MNIQMSPTVSRVLNQALVNERRFPRFIESNVDSYAELSAAEMAFLAKAVKRMADNLINVAGKMRLQRISDELQRCAEIENKHETRRKAVATP